MLTKFRITFNDGTFMESHDECYNEIKVHAHALPPHSNKKWAYYSLITDENKTVTVDFQRGIFVINGQEIHPASASGIPLTDKTDLQDFAADSGRQILNHMPYFPIFGVSMLFGDWGEAKVYFCGWKRKEGEKTIEKIAYIYPTGAIVLT